MWNGFTVARKSEPIPIEIPGMGYTPWRVPLQVRYEGREFGTIAFEVAIDETSAEHHELVTPDDLHLATFTIESPGLVACLEVPYQIAQKLHACTEPRPDGNDRVRDVIDISFLEALLEPGQFAEVRTAAIETFARRKLHAWPPTVEASPSETRDYARLVDGLTDAPIDVDEAVRYLTELIERVDTS